MRLALETSRRGSSWALRDAGGHSLGSGELGLGQSFGSVGIAALDDLFLKAGLQPRNIQRLALNIGPGSATGLRLGVALAQAFDLIVPDIVVEAIPLEAIALQALEDGVGGAARQALLLENAYGGEFFVQKYVRAGSWELVGELLRCNEEGLNIPEDGVVLTGAEKKLLKHSDVPWMCADWLNAACVADAAHAKDYATPIRSLGVRYLKETSAEILWRKRHGT